MTRRESQSIRLQQLGGQVGPATPLRQIQRPVGGWLRAVRQALGLSLKAVAQRLKVSPQAVHQLEKSEAAGTVSLGQLENVAAAMGCRVVYTLVPRDGTLAELAHLSRDQMVRSAQHSMALEGQAITPEESRHEPTP